MRGVAIVSACLLGEYCRYDGTTKKNEAILRRLEGYEIVPFCPEAPVFGTPRERIDVVEINGKITIRTHIGKQDVTELLEKQVQKFVKEHTSADIVVLKSKSPSCALATAPIYDESGKIVAYGDGIAARMLRNRYENARFFDENGYIND